jgi:hypothetical protein
MIDNVDWYSLDSSRRQKLAEACAQHNSLMSDDELAQLLTHIYGINGTMRKVGKETL